MKRTEFNRNQTITAIRQCFIELYAVNGIEKISVQQICQHCNISRTIFYKYFDDKYSILEEIEQDLLDGITELNRNLPQTPLQNYKPGMPFPVFYETVNFIKENEIYFKPLLGPHGDPQFIFRWKKQIRKDIKAKFEHDKIPTCNLNVVTELFAAAIIGLYTYWFYEDASLSAQTISEIAGNQLCGSFYTFKK